MEYFRDLAQPGDGVFGLPDKFQFDHLFSEVKTAFWLWKMSGFQRLPPLEEVRMHDPRYISDMQLAYNIYSFYQNDSPLFRLLDELEGQNGTADNTEESGMT